MSKTPSTSRRVRDAEEVLEEIRSDLLECKVCFEVFTFNERTRRPQNLPCGHVICQECICALSHPPSRRLQCPFCRVPCDEGATYECQALVSLQDVLGSYFAESDRKAPNWQERFGSGIMCVCRVSGGWGRIVNPTGVAVFGSDILVVHGGSERLAVFSHHGKLLRSFGREICYPLDVAAAPSGHIVITDAGDCSVKVFSSTGGSLTVISGTFELPWGVDVDCSGHILVTDAEAGTLWQVILDFQRGIVLVKRVVLKNLERPRAVASCRSTECTLVLERSGNRGMLSQLKLFSKDFVLLKQVDSFNLDPTNWVRLSISTAAFSKEGGVIVADTEHGMVWSLGDLRQAAVLNPLVKEGLARPVGLAMMDEALVVVDAEDHTVKIYSPSAESSSRPS